MERIFRKSRFIFGGFYERWKGTPIGPMDLLIAGHAKAKDLVLVTNNTREFLRVEDLQVEDWTVG